MAHHTAQRLSWKKVAGLGSHPTAQRLNWKKVAELALHTHTRTVGLPLKSSYGVVTPEENDSLAESHGLSQDEYGEPRDHSAQNALSTVKQPAALKGVD